MSASPGRLRHYQQRRFIRVCGCLGVWALAVTIGGFALGTVLALVLAGLVLTLRTVFGSLAASPVGPLLAASQRRPWRDYEEVLDTAARHLDSTFRRSLDGTLLAPSLVKLVVHPHTLARISTTITLATAEYELLGRFVESVQTLGARLAHVAAPRVVVVASDSIPIGGYRLVPDFRPPTPGGSAEAATVDMSGPTGSPGSTPTKTYETATLRLMLATGARTFSPDASDLVTVGAGSDCDVKLPVGSQRYVSRRHAELRWTLTEGWTLVDTSTNGTLVNEVRAKGAVSLRPGDVLRFGTRTDAPTAIVSLANGSVRNDNATRQEPKS